MNETTLGWLNSVDHQAADELFLRCCGSKAWCLKMVKCRPFSDIEHLHLTADIAMDELGDVDWQEAFSCHPPIGNLESLRMKFTGNREWSAGEQSGVVQADEQVLAELASQNAKYRAKFGFIFIVCATGKSAHEMLAILNHRIELSPTDELKNAALEQRKITHLRLDKLEK